MQSQEIWKPVVGYEDRYLVSSKGEIMSLRWEGSNQQRILKHRHCTSGYEGVDLYKNGKARPVMIHRVVAEAFIPNPNNYPCVNHKNEDKTDNRAENLEWCSYGYNNSYNGKGKRVQQSRRERGTMGRAVLQMTLDGVVVKRYPTITDAVRETGNRGIWTCCSNPKLRKTASGYRWVYESPKHSKSSNHKKRNSTNDDVEE